ncbi:MAG: TonB-dependent receptor plug domain-containing protein [candidate division WOR-3 bacterium]
MLIWFLLSQPPEYTTDTVMVLGTRLPPGFSEAMSSVWTMDSSWLSRLPWHFDRALLFSPGLWIRNRGLPGVQCDIGIGPGNYTQTSLMVNGFRCDDPQTAHHSADIPLGLAEIERVEVARGGASGLSGPGASSGAVNLVTAEPIKGTRADAFVGSFGTAGTGMELGNGWLSVGMAGERSDGPQKGSDYRTLRGFQKARIGTASVFAGYSWKGFGAWNFYAPYPSREWTSSGLITINWEGIRFGMRRHTDRFLLLEHDPSFYENNHIKTSASCSWNKAIGPSTIGLEASWWELRSDRLGYHQAPSGALVCQTGIGSGPLVLALGARGDWQYGPGFAPSLNGGISCLEGELKGRISGSLATRFPSATEMYYQDPGNKGNPGLLPERTKRGEIALGWRCIDLGAFVAEYENLIDWVRDSGIWEAVNLKGIRAYGGWAELKTWWLFFGWWYQKKLAEADRESKYALRTPSNSIKAGVPWLFLSWEDGRCLISFRVSLSRGPFTLSLLGDNLLNQSYEPVPGLPGPPRALAASLVFKER